MGVTWRRTGRCYRGDVRQNSHNARVEHFIQSELSLFNFVYHTSLRCCQANVCFRFTMALQTGRADYTAHASARENYASMNKVVSNRYSDYRIYTLRSSYYLGPELLTGPCFDHVPDVRPSFPCIRLSTHHEAWNGVERGLRRGTVQASRIMNNTNVRSMSSWTTLAWVLELLILLWV